MCVCVCVWWWFIFVGLNVNWQMHAELQVLSPLVPVREVNFLRFCKQHAEGVWAVVDVSIDSIIRETSSGSFMNSLCCRRLPSGCIVQDMPNGYSKVSLLNFNSLISQFVYTCSFYSLSFFTFVWYNSIKLELVIERWFWLMNVASSLYRTTVCHIPMAT